MNSFLAAALAAALSLTVVQATAAPDASRSEIVRFDDLDLNRLDDAAALYRRLHSAARAVCGPSLSQRAVSDRLVYEACVDDSIVEAAAAIDRDLLIEYVERRIR